MGGGKCGHPLRTVLKGIQVRPDHSLSMSWRHSPLGTAEIPGTPPAPMVTRGNDDTINERQTARNDAPQGWASAGTSWDRARVESKRVSTHPLLQRPTGQALLLTHRQARVRRPLNPNPSCSKPDRPSLAVLYIVPHRWSWLLISEL
jgi:hypothetical protein